MSRYTQKQIDKFHRQKYITEIEKISKNLFRMFRDTKVSSQEFTLKFEALKRRLDEKEPLRLDSEYHQQLQEYIVRLYGETVACSHFDDKTLDTMREAEMSNLNRLQKLKNLSNYKKEKHRSRQQEEDWG
jgi:hypothetical protein